MKKSVYFFLGAAILLGMVSCSSEESSSSSNYSSITSSVSSTSSSSSTDSLENVISILDVSKDCVVGTDNENDFIKGPFTIVKGTEIRSRTKTWTDPTDSSKTKSFTSSIKIGSSSNALKVKSNGTGTLDIYVQNGSSGVATRTVTFSKTGGNVTSIKIPGDSTSPDLPDYPAGSPCVKVSIPVNEGDEYTINRDSGTIDIYYAELNVIVEKAEVVGFEIVSKGTTEYVEGQTYDKSGIQLNAVYGNDRRDAIDPTSTDIVIDSSAVNMSVPGEYNVSVKYKNFVAQTIKVTVYQFDAISLGFNKMAKGSNSKAGNSTYVNNTVRRVFKKNETFNADNLTVKAMCTHPTDATKKMNFILKESEYSINSASYNNAEDGTYSIPVQVILNNKTKSVTYEVSVVSAAPAENEGVLQLKVTPSYEGVIGAVQDSYNQFKTIQQALDYLGTLDSSYDSKKKILEIGAGEYKEKLEINIPNLTIRGAGKDDVKIEWDSLYGLEDESGYMHVTDSTQTVAIRDDAVNCTIEGVTISNFYNCEEHFTEKLGANYSEHRALALLCQADKFTMDNCKLLGYQDTVEFFTGRQIIKDTYICGTTDFIFGTNNTTYFYNCEIHSIANAKNNGGYITAFKGCNKGANDAIQYGAIFDKCNFTADASILALKKTSIGRCWGAYSAVMVMNSTLGGHIALTTSKGSSKDYRYVAMNADPSDATVKFTEYNNSGEGAIQTSIDGVTVFQASNPSDVTSANAYKDFQIIFGTENGAYQYQDAWDIPSLNVM